MYIQYILMCVCEKSVTPPKIALKRRKIGACAVTLSRVTSVISSRQNPLFRCHHR